MDVNDFNSLPSQQYRPVDFTKAAQHAENKRVEQNRIMEPDTNTSQVSNVQKMFAGLEASNKLKEQQSALDNARAMQESKMNVASKNVVKGLGDGSMIAGSNTIPTSNFVGIHNSSDSKATENNNPGSITGMSGKLLYGATGFANSKTGDKGDQTQLVYASPQDGWNAMRSLMSSDRYNSAPIRGAFKQYQTDQVAYAKILDEYIRKGIDVDKQTFNSLSPALQNEFMKTRARWEGYRGVGPQ